MHVSTSHAAVNDRTTTLYPLWIESVPSDADIDRRMAFRKQMQFFLNRHQQVATCNQRQ